MTTPRRSHTATLLPSGKVLVTGGMNNVPAAVSSAELYDPVAKTWTAVATMSRPRQQHTATLLASGKVLVAGGNSNGSDHQTTAEIYDPGANTWTATGDIPSAHSQHAAVRLSDGKVLVVGGYITDAVALFDPSGNAWAALPKMPAGTRVGPAATQLSSGKVLVVGGRVDVELLDPVAKTWSSTASASIGHEAPAFVLQQSGKVYAGGGWDGSKFTTLIEAWDPATGTWSKVGDLLRGNGPAVVLGDGRWLVPGGYLGDKSVEIFDPATAKSTAITAMTTGRTDHSLTVLGDGRVLIAGGSTGAAIVSTAEIFALQQNGEACTTAKAAECASKICVDGVCCNTTCTEACKACDVTGSVGTCSPVASGAPHGARSCTPFATCTAGACSAACTADTECTSTSWCGTSVCQPKKPNGDACAADRECTSGSCTDGVCCDARCNGQCEACDVTKGKCLPVPANEKPHGSRAACVGEGIGTTCGIRCDGVERTRCTYPTPLAICGVDSCAGGVETHRNVCDGAGKCTDVARSCGAYQCDGATCRTACTAEADCIALHQCVEGKCVPKTARCAADGRSSIGADDTVTPCHPYTCKEARCSTECTSSTECAQGYACDPATKACAPAAPPAEDGGGCSHGARGGSARGWLALLVVAAGARRRRAHEPSKNCPRTEVRGTDSKTKPSGLGKVRTRRFCPSFTKRDR